MGTRGATGFKLDDHYVLYYNHFDSYPDGLGQEVVKFCKDLKRMNLDEVKERVRKVEFINEEIEPTPEQIEMYRKFADLNVSSKKETDWYCLLRNCQGVTGLYNIAEGKQFHVSDASEFVKDSLFCEFAYIVNLDNGTIEFYKRGIHSELRSAIKVAIPNIILVSS